MHSGLKVRGGVHRRWDRFDAGIYGLKPTVLGASVPSTMSDLGQSAGPALAEGNSDRPWSPDSPLFWFGALLAVTFGLIGAATSIRVGPFKAAVSAGKS
jgi:hypothetical protein